MKLSEIEKGYTMVWSLDSNLWSVMDVYSDAAKLLDLKDGETHVDFGTGLAFLPQELLRLAPNSRILAVERGESMLQAATSRLTKYGIEHEIVRDFDPAREFGNGIFLIQEDIRDCKILSGIIGDRQIDSASYTFRGAGIDIAFSEGAEVDTKSAEIMRQAHARTAMIQMDTKRAVLRFISEKVRTGGRFLIMDRTDVPYQTYDASLSDPSEMKFGIGIMQISELDDYITNWSIVDAGTIKEDVGNLQKSRLYFEGEDVPTKTHEEYINCITYGLFIRNKVPVLW